MLLYAGALKELVYVVRRTYKIDGNACNLRRVNGKKVGNRYKNNSQQQPVPVLKKIFIEV